MTVIAIASSKGGPGKTLVTQVLAASLAVTHRLVVIDADPTEAFSRWAGSAYEGAKFETFAETDETRLAHLIAEAAGRSDLVLLDTAGFNNRAATVAMMSADAVIVPSLVGEADVTEAERTIKLVEGLARASRRDIPARVMLNRVRKTTLAKHAASEIQSAGLPRLTATFGDYVGLSEVSYTGRLPTSGPVVAEIEALIAELQRLGWISCPTSVRNSSGT